MQWLLIGMIAALVLFLTKNKVVAKPDTSDKDEIFVRAITQGTQYQVRSQYGLYIYAAAQRYEVPPALLDAIIHVESADGRNAGRGTSGEIGVMQILPSTAGEIQRLYPEMRMYSAATPAQAIAMAAGYLRYHYQLLGDWKKTAIRYNSVRVAEVDHPYYLRLVQFLAQ